LVLGWKEINGTPHFYSLPQGEIKEYPLTLTLSRVEWRGDLQRERRDERKILTTRPHPDPLPRGGEGMKEDEKDLNNAPHPDPLPLVGRGNFQEGRKDEKIKRLK
jgi:hypothetical protein